MLNLSRHNYDNGSTGQRSNGPPSGRLKQTPPSRLPHVNWRGGLYIQQIIPTVYKRIIEGFPKEDWTAINELVMYLGHQHLRDPNLTSSKLSHGSSTGTSW